MGGAWLPGAATVRPHSMLNTSPVLPTSSSSQPSIFPVHGPTSIPSESTSCLRRLGSDVPSYTHQRRSSRAVVAAKSEASVIVKPRRRTAGRVSSAVAEVAEVADLVDFARAGPIENIYKESLFARLEHTYKQPTFDLLVSDLEAKLQLAFKDGSDVRDAGSNVTCDDDLSKLPSNSSSSTEAPKRLIPLEVVARSLKKPNHKGHSSISKDLRVDFIGPGNSTPKVVRKRNPRRPKVAGDQIVRISKNASPRKPRRGPSVEPKDQPKITVEKVVAADRGGKRRLSLTSRIAMKKVKEEKFRKSKNSYAVDTENLRPEDEELWSQEAEDLINRYSISLDLTAPLWDKLDRGLLSAAEECSLAVRMKPMKKLEKLRTALNNEIGREPSDEELASAAKIDSPTLRRQLLLSRAARTKLIQHNLRLVLSQAHKYYKESMSLSLHDLCQEGVVGLMHAVDKFDPKKGYRFSTYGIYWIRNSILRAQTKSGHMLRSPVNVSMHRVNIKRTAMELRLELDRSPTNNEIMQRLGIPADRFRDIQRTNMRTLSLHEHDRITGKERVESLVDNEDVMSAVANKTSMLRYGMDDVLDSLRPKENMVLRQRFGLDGKGERSLSEVGFNLNLSREMVRRYELRGILRMKHPTRVDYLRNYLA